MRQIIALWLAALMLAAQPIQAAVCVGFGQSAAPSGDSCAGSLLYSHHAENNDAADTDANGTQGCSASETYKSWAKTSAVYDNTSGYYGDGTYSLKSNGYNHRATITTTGWMDLTSTGSISMWFRGNGANDSYPFDITIDSTHYIYGLYYYSTGLVRILYRDGTANIYINSGTALPATGGWIQFGWDAASDLIQVRVCDDAECSGESWMTKTDTAIVDIGTMPSSMTIGGKSGSSAYGWADNVKIYSSSNCQ